MIIHFFSCFLQGRGFSKATTAKEAKAFVGDASCTVNILQVSTRRKNHITEIIRGTQGFVQINKYFQVYKVKFMWDIPK